VNDTRDDNAENNGFPAAFPPMDWDAALDVEKTIAGIPLDATTKGMFFNDCLNARKRGGLEPWDKHYTLFKDYPQRDFCRLAADTAAALYPDLSLRRALRELGRTAYPTIANTHIGRMIFGVLGSDIRRIMRVARKGYGVSMSHISVQHIDDGANFAHTRLTNIFIFPTAYQPGVFDGAIEAVGQTGETRARVVGAHTVEFYARWWTPE